MFKFIKLTESCRDGLTKEILLNINYIKFIQSGESKKDTYIGMFDKTYYFVVESLKEIEGLIGK